jgi:hypothetical protein
MPNQKRSLANSRVPRAGLAVFGIVLLSIMEHDHILENWFTGTDTITLIQSSIVRNPADLWAIFTKRMCADSSFPEQFSFYRPISSLTYSLDYGVWRLNPLGYHLSNLLLHSLVCAMVLLVTMELTRGELKTAIMSALLFTLHPLHKEVVPDPELRHDILSALFFLLSLWWFFRWFSARRRHVVGRVMSLVCFVLALGAKETAAYLPFVIMGYAAINPKGIQPGRERIKHAGRTALPYILALAGVYLWRLSVLGGVGGYQSQWWRLGLLSRKPWLVAPMIKKLVMTLWYPTQLLDDLGHAALIIPTVVIIFSVLILRADAGRLSRGLIAFKVALLLVPITASWHISTWAPRPNLTVESSADIPFQVSSETKPDGNYPEGAQAFLPQSPSGKVRALLFLSIVVLVAQLTLGSAQELSGLLERQRMGIFAVITGWLTLAIAPHLLGTHLWQPYYGYHVLIPFCTLGAIAVATCTRRMGVLRQQVISPAGGNKPTAVRARAALVCLFLIFGPPLYSSPALRGYEGWRENGELARANLESLVALAATLDDERSLVVHGLPGSVTPRNRWFATASERYCLASYSIESWLKLHDPNFGSRIVVENYSRLISLPKALEAVVLASSAESLAVTLRPRTR